MAERIQLAVLGAKHEVFFDAASLAAGSDYNSQILEAIAQCDLYIFLISPHSIANKRYVQTELTLVKAKWPKPWGHILPVVISPVDYELIDPYLASATFLEPRANVAAEVAARVDVFAKGITTASMCPAERSTSLTEPPNTNASGPLQYYCYISHSKIDQLLSNLQPNGNQNFASSQSDPSHGEYEPQGSLIPYGRPDMFHRDAIRMRQRALRLHTLLELAAQSTREFMWEYDGSHILYRYSGKFSVMEIDRENLIAKLVTEHGGCSLVLHCSLSNFSHTTILNGKASFQSTNYGFFVEKNPVHFEALFLLSSATKPHYYGSPICLKLPIKSGLSL
jgi:hypothetical protein